MKIKHFIPITSLDIKEFIKNAYKENKLARDILAVLYNRKAVKYIISLNKLGSYSTITNLNV